MNKFDIHIGQINRLYQEYWWINEYTYEERHELHNEIKTALISTCDAIGDYDTLKSYMDRIPNLIYDLNEFKVNIEGELINISKWLAEHDRFANFIYLEETGLWRVYHWSLDRILKPTEKGYNKYFALLWKMTDTSESDDLIDYQISKDFSTSKREVIIRLKKIVLEYPLLLPKTKFDELIELYSQNSSDQNHHSSDDGKKIVITKAKISSRVQGDNLTSLNARETAVLISLMRQLKIILPDNDSQSEINVAKAWQALTGYSNGTLRDKQTANSITKSELKNLQSIAIKLKMLIDRKLL